MQIGDLPNKIVTFLKEVKLEVKKVDWSSKKEIVNYTMVVVGVCLAVAAFCGVLDLGFSEGLKALLNK